MNRRDFVLGGTALFAGCSTPGVKLDAPYVSTPQSVVDTMLALAGVKRVGDKPQDGRDLSPLLRTGLDADWAPRHLFQTWGSNISVRTETHRLDAAGNLFDMTADPGQTTPLQAKLPALAQELGVEPQ